MEKNLSELTCRKFSNELFSKEPIPGGGGTAAFIGALGVSLCAMAGNLTVGKAKYAEVEEDVKRMLGKLEILKERLLELIDKDAENFEPLSKAYSMPKDSPGYAENMYRVTMAACEAPFEIMKCCCKAIEITAEMAGKCSRLMISDAGCAAYAAAAALRCASLNVFINTKMFRGDEAADDLERRAKEMLEKYCSTAEKTGEAVLAALCGQ